MKKYKSEKQKQTEMEERYKESRNELKSFISDLCFELGLNTAHDYDGVETEEDIKIYKKAVIEELSGKNKETTIQRFQENSQLQRVEVVQIDYNFSDLFVEKKLNELIQKQNNDGFILTDTARVEKTGYSSFFIMTFMRQKHY